MGASEGDRVRFVREVWRYPHFIVGEGATGVVTYVGEDAVHVRLDEVLAGAEEWDNEVHWYAHADDDPSHDVSEINEDVEVLS